MREDSAWVTGIRLALVHEIHSLWELEMEVSVMDYETAGVYKLLEK